MKAVSLFSGAGGFEIGFDRAGIDTVLQVESDPWCREVLARHWPDTRRLTDVRDMGRPESGLSPALVATSRLAALGCDLVYGGFPCQDVSVAGQRAGLRGERSGLWSEFARILSELRPRWCVVENVPGLLSSDGGRDFLRILMDLDELGYGVAWRVLDGRWFGVPQRRRRVFLVGCLGDAARAAQVLAVCESCGGHPAASQEAGQDIAPTLDDGARRASVELPMIAAGLTGGGHPGSMPGRHHEDDDNLIIQSEFGGRVRSDPRSLAAELALPITNRQGIGNPDVQNFLVAAPVRASDGHHGHSSGRGDGADNLVTAFDWQSGEEGDTSFRGGSRAYRVRAGDYAGGLSSSRHDAVSYSGGVRRLTPLEAERLMGWPDFHTRWTADGREIPDSHRYRLCGNGVIATVAEWLGHRLVEADSWES